MQENSQKKLNFITLHNNYMVFCQRSVKGYNNLQQITSFPLSFYLFPRFLPYFFCKSLLTISRKRCIIRTINVYRICIGFPDAGKHSYSIYRILNIQGC